MRTNLVAAKSAWAIAEIRHLDAAPGKYRMLERSSALIFNPACLVIGDARSVAAPANEWFELASISED
jgi:hypothetical protein